MVILGDLVLLFALFLSANMALGGAFFLMVSRWAALALGLGLVSYRGLEWISAAIQRSDAGPQRLAWVFAFLVPLPALAATVWGLDRGWMTRHRRPRWSS